MEIIQATEITVGTWSLGIGILCVIIGLIIVGIAGGYESWTGITIGGIMVIIGFALLIIFPTETVDPNQMKYTIEITDDNVYKTLIQQGYKFKRLFDSKEIYEIVGDVIK